MIESKYLKDNIENIQKLMNIPTVRHFETRSLGKLLKLSKIREYEDGERIITEGEKDPWFYFLLQGKVRVVKQGIPITTLSQMGEIFGEMRIIDKQSRSASVYAQGKTICLAVNTAARKDHPKEGTSDERLEFLILLYRIFAEFMTMRLRLTNEELVKAKREKDRT